VSPRHADSALPHAQAVKGDGKRKWFRAEKLVKTPKQPRQQQKEQSPQQQQHAAIHVRASATAGADAGTTRPPAMQGSTADAPRAQQQEQLLLSPPAQQRVSPASHGSGGWRGLFSSRRSPASARRCSGCSSSPSVECALSRSTPAAASWTAQQQSGASEAAAARQVLQVVQQQLAALAAVAGHGEMQPQQAAMAPLPHDLLQACFTAEVSTNATVLAHEATGCSCTLRLRAA
jgi:hypothetical protein